ncbi:MAG TPA: protein translocase subunit SecF [Candidatus Sulfobium mesophilum]|nr:protein translocase subunit SecF [Candidatus Sulfobium mesophilum]
MIELIKNSNINFMGMRKHAFAVTAAMSLLGIIAIIQIARGNANLGVDFTGGTAVQIKFARSVPLQEVRVALEQGGLKDFEVQDLPSENKVLIKTKKQESTLGETAEAITRILSTELSATKPLVNSTTEVGPKVGSRLKQEALWAMTLAALGIVVYIAFRFQFRFGIAATLATIHDVLAVLGILYLLDREMNLIILSALLTIAGYSLSDTVVVFDRLRENMKASVKEPLESIINRSINEVLSRTIVTGITTLLSALALFLFGGEVLHDFSLSIILGIVIGTYSSIFVASPLVVLLGEVKRKESGKKEQARVKQSV